MTRPLYAPLATLLAPALLAPALSLAADGERPAEFGPQPPAAYRSEEAIRADERELPPTTTAQERATGVFAAPPTVVERAPTAYEREYVETEPRPVIVAPVEERVPRAPNRPEAGQTIGGGLFNRQGPNDFGA